MNDYICRTHLRDWFLLELFDGYTADSGDFAEECDICAETADAMPIDDLAELISSVISRHYDTVSESPPEMEDGEFLAITYELDEVLDDIGFIEAVDAPLLNRIIARLPDDHWVPKGLPQRSTSQRLSDGWRSFCDHIAHTSRFLLVPDEPNPAWDPDPDIRPSKMLENIANLVTSTRLDLLDELPAGTAVYRARSYDETRPTNPADYVSPPADIASQGRMNAAGISVLYAAFDPETAATETFGGHAYAAVAELTVVEPLTVVDLTKIPALSIFDLSVAPRDYEHGRFLQDFAADIAKPIVRDDRIHYEYVPTQYLTEYLHWQLGGGHLGVDGIVFASARRPAGRNVVLFAGPGDCLPADPLQPRQQRRLLELQPTVTVYRYGGPSLSHGLVEPLAGR